MRMDRVEKGGERLLSAGAIIGEAPGTTKRRTSESPSSAVPSAFREDAS
jgi:hypothetical protein